MTLHRPQKGYAHFPEILPILLHPYKFFILLTFFVISVNAISPRAGFANDQADREQIRLATRLFEIGKFDEAAPLIRKLRLQPNPGNQVIFLSGALFYQQGNYLSAAEEFRQLLIIDPSLLRPRLELARALYKAKNYPAASYHFEQVLAAPLPETVSWNVRNFLRDIRERSSKYTFSLDLISDSNPTQSTSSKVINIRGVEYKLKDNAQANKSWGVAFTGNAKWPIEANPSIYRRARVEISEFEDNALNWSFLQLMAGKHFRYTNHTLTVEGGGHISYYGGEPLYDGLALGVSEHFKPKASTDWLISYDLKELNYDDYSYYSSLHHSISANWLYADTPVSRWQLGLEVIKHDANEQPYSFTSPILSGRYLYEWSGGLITGINLEYSDIPYKEADPLFDIKRHDRKKRIEIELINRNWQWQGLAVRLITGIVSHNSNLDLYRFRREYIRLGLTNEF